MLLSRRHHRSAFFFKLVPPWWQENLTSQSCVNGDESAETYDADSRREHSTTARATDTQQAV